MNSAAASRRGRRRRRGGTRAAGFTLIEVVVAFVLLAAVLGVGFEIFSTGLRRAGELEDYSRALVIAQSRLAAAAGEAPLAEGLSQGESEDRRFRWSVAVALSPEGAPAPGQPQNNSYALYRLETVVSWQGADTRTRSLALSTLGLAPRPQ